MKKKEGGRGSFGSMIMIVVVGLIGRLLDLFHVNGTCGNASPAEKRVFSEILRDMEEDARKKTEKET